MTLREELAARLHDLMSAARRDEMQGTGRPNARSIYDVGLQAAADEVIRQMEFARHECPFEWAGGADPETGAGGANAILRIAPPDWKP